MAVDVCQALMKVNKVASWKLFQFVVTFAGYVLDDIPVMKEDGLTVTQQLEMIRNWGMKPDFIINIKVVHRAHSAPI
jgi:hypothetical protein